MHARFLVREYFARLPTETSGDSIILTAGENHLCQCKVEAFAYLHSGYHEG